MKNKIKILAIGLIIATGFNACKKDSAEIDTEYPTIDITASDASPKQCAVLTRGQQFTFKANLSDNVELGSVSVDVHHNFDHHSHSTEVSNCTMDAKKTPVKPYLLIQSFPIPTGQKQYTVNQQISIPADIDPGDYHFLIRLTDKEGWQTLKGISIKIQ